MEAQIQISGSQENISAFVKKSKEVFPGVDLQMIMDLLNEEPMLSQAFELSCGVKFTTKAVNQNGR